LSVVTVDASAAAAWLLPDEANDAADRLFARARSGAVSLLAPGLWVWEIGNLLRMAVRRQRLTAELRDEAIEVLGRVTVHLDAPPVPAQMQRTLALADAEGLSYYDASYVELALRTGAAIATRDAAVRGAAARRGVPCVEC
jgi:predicted nucleic acid-binding protein